MFDCGHMAFCIDCSIQILSKQPSNCPMCSKTVQSRNRVSLSEFMKYSKNHNCNLQNVITID